MLKSKYPNFGFVTFTDELKTNTAKMKLLYYIPLLCVTLMFSLQSCDETTDVPVDFGYDYFPLEVGKYMVYEVDSVVYDITTGSSSITTNTIQVREEITNSFVDNEGRTVFRLERSERQDAASPWSVRDVWTTAVTDRQAERVEENLRFIKLVFPVSTETTPWNGNKFIDETTVISVAGESISVFKNWLYEYRTTGESVEVNGELYSDVTTVYQADEENLIELRLSKEQYARGVGMIYREMKILDTQCIAPCETMTWEEKAEKGFIVRQTLVEYN